MSERSIGGGDSDSEPKVGEAAIDQSQALGGIPIPDSFTDELDKELDEQRITIRSCPCCDGNHSQVKFRSYARQQGVWTHYFHCPNTGDPVPICVKLIDGRVRRLDQNVIQSLANVFGQGWMVAVFHYNGDVVHVDRHTRDFSPDHFEASIRALSIDLTREAGKTIGVPDAPVKVIKPGDPGFGPVGLPEMTRAPTRPRRVEDLS